VAELTGVAVVGLISLTVLIRRREPPGTCAGAPVFVISSCLSCRPRMVVRR